MSESHEKETAEGPLEQEPGVLRRALEAERDSLLRRLHLQVERMPLAYLLFDADLRIVDWNPMAQRIFGYGKEEVLGMGPPFELILPPSARQQTDEVLRRLKAKDVSAHSVNENLTKDGRTITCEWFNIPLQAEDGQFSGLLCLAQEITERLRLEEQVRQAQKMEAIGQLAAGVAHDFNNLLTIINGHCELLLLSLRPDDPGRRSLEEIRKAGERSASLTRQLLAFSRKQVLAPKVLDLNEVVRETEKILRRVIGEDVELATSLHPALDRVKADPGQIEQILLTLAVNARDAMPQGGQLTLETKNVEVDEDYARAHAGTRPGAYVMLAVTDSGVGMTENVKRHAFEPFFTTKGPGRGTGMGLAAVHGIVEQSGGHIELYSEPGIGTSFKIYLPTVEAPVPSSQNVQSPAPAPAGTGTILVVEDEEAVRSLVRYVLEQCGYTVLEAGQGHEALEICTQFRDPIHLLVTDVVMPGMGGRVLAERLAGLHPETKVLYLSGYTDDAVVRHGILQEQVNFLQKPFSPFVLAQKVREVLAG